MSEPQLITFDPINRDVLLRMRAGGDTLIAPRPVHFSIIFPSQGSAASFMERLEIPGCTCKLEEAGTHPWDVTVVRRLVPSEESIGESEYLLEEVAGPLGGKNDGWFCERIVDSCSSGVIMPTREPQ